MGEGLKRATKAARATRRRSQPSRTEFCQLIAKALVEFGYPSVTAEKIKQCLDDYLDDKPIRHGVIGMFAKREFDRVEEARPGAMQQLADE